MTKPDIKEEEKPFSEDKSKAHKNEPKEKKDFPAKEETAEDKLKAVEEKLLRAIAETENQRRRFERERQEAFDFGGFNFARESLSLLDNIDRAINSFKNDDALKNNKILGAASDVFEHEPYSGKLCNLENIILTPHIGSYAKEGKLQMEVDAVKNLLKNLEK